MRTIKGRELQRAGYVREFIFTDTKALSAYLRTLRGKWYILDQTIIADGRIKVTIVQQYNGVPVWEL